MVVGGGDSAPHTVPSAQGIGSGCKDGVPYPDLGLSASASRCCSPVVLAVLGEGLSPLLTQGVWPWNLSLGAACIMGGPLPKKGVPGSLGVALGAEQRGVRL